MQVAKWGNSLAVRLPAALVDALELKEGDCVDLTPIGRDKLGVSRQSDVDAAFEKLRKLRGRAPASFRFDRERANQR